MSVVELKYPGEGSLGNFADGDVVLPLEESFFKRVVLDLFE
jgi:hypothetical protein